MTNFILNTRPKTANTKKMTSNTEEWNSWQTKKVPWVFPDDNNHNKYNDTLDEIWVIAC